ncbi:MAG: F0F1 ATP synthase subunit B' [Pseudoprimorskyibacter sp.]|jgi:F-type H+-transporting ATPase subunit b|nr:F0F1 ATP synthase subunit B' [Pseudoprimorskyibacter sp.]
MATEPINEEIAGTCVDSYGSAVGMPQLCFEWFPNQILWLVITLVVIFLVLSRIALPRIAAVLAERQGTIDSDISAAETLKLQAEAAEAAYQKALTDARAQAQGIAKETRAAIQKDLDAAIEKADTEIAAKTAQSEKAIADIRASALDSVEIVAKEAAVDLVQALGINANDADIVAAVDSQLKG